MEKEKEEAPEVVLDQVAETLLQEPVKIRVTMPPANRWEKWLQKHKLMPAEKVFELKPLYMGTLLRQSRILMTMDMEDIRRKINLAGSLALIDEQLEKLALCVALALHNRDTEPPARLLNFILKYFTAKEMYLVILQVIDAMDVKSFTLSIISIRGVHILPMTKTASVTNAEN